MKKYLYSVTSKVICFILCIVSLVVTIACIWSSLYMQGNGFYDTNINVMIGREFSNYVKNDLINIAYFSLATDYSENDDGYSYENSNLRYHIIDSEGNLIESNLDTITNGQWKHIMYFLLEKQTEGFNNIIEIPKEEFDEKSNDNYVIEAYLEEGLPVNDRYSFMSDIIGFLYKIKYAVYYIGALSLLLAIITFVILMTVSGRRYDSKELYPGALNSVPIDLLIAIPLVILGIIISIVEDSYFDEFFQIYLAIGFVALILFVGISMSISARVKQRNLIKNTIIFKACKLIKKTILFIFDVIKKIISVVPLAWKAMTVFVIVSFLELLVISNLFYDDDVFYFLWIVERLIIVLLMLYFTGVIRRTFNATRIMETGVFGHRIDTSFMFGEFKRHAQSLNSIAEISNAAVEKRLQSERMKTELITNVSHDIKTPLTSIINYSSLITEQSCNNENHSEYAQILLKKSKDLKRLLEDLIEVSKTSSGNVELNLMNCDANILVEQIFGEYKEKTEKNGLDLVISSFPQKEIIKVDSKKIWRVFENVMNNACKYSMHGTRVYVDCKVENDKALFIFKNTSKSSLNISPEEIMERFVRGDSSRMSEGSGLGLSIAKNLVELQSGTFELYIDGDLFKVVIGFPLQKE